MTFISKCFTCLIFYILSIHCIYMYVCILLYIFALLLVVHWPFLDDVVCFKNDFEIDYCIMFYARQTCVCFSHEKFHHSTLTLYQELMQIKNTYSHFKTMLQSTHENYSISSKTLDHLICWRVNYFLANRTSAYCHVSNNPDSKFHGANMGPTWVLSAPDGPHVGPMNLAIRECTLKSISHL